MAEPFYYGGQALIEGVMIRGRTAVALAVRRPNGQVTTQCAPLAPIFTGRMRKVPFVRGVIVLAEAMIIGLRALMYSANTALEDEQEEPAKIPGWASSLMLTVSLVIAIGLFFIGPLLLTRAVSGWIDSNFLMHLVEGAIRLTIFVAYVWALGRTKDMKRVFAYHGAEHMTIAAHEHGAPLDVGEIRKYPKEHPRCGTAFLLVVMVVAIIVFAFTGRPGILWSIVTRVVLVPLIAGISYEIIRFNAKHINSFIGKAVTSPGLLMQFLTTRKPEDDQIEVAIKAMNTALEADGVRTAAAPSVN